VDESLAYTIAHAFFWARLLVSWMILHDFMIRRVHYPEISHIKDCPG
jgi:hypothetical protein